MDTKKLLHEILTRKKTTPEEMQKEEENRKLRAKLKEEERQRQEAERIRREGEVKALFDEHIVYGKKFYAARVPKLLEYLKTKKNAITFWENPHIKKLYDISNERNFLCSIYTEETEDNVYERCLHRHLSNPFNNSYVINYECLARSFNAYDYNIAFQLNTILSFCRETCYVTESQLIEDYGDGFSDDYVASRFMKAKKFGDLLDKNVTVSRLAHSNNEETVYILNPLFITENHFLRLDAYNVWRRSMKNEWAEIENKVPNMIKLLNELVRTRRIYLREINK